MSTKMTIRGRASTTQNPNMIHLLRVTRRALRPSNSPAAKGFASKAAGLAGAMTSLISRVVGLLHPLDDEIGGHVEATGDDKQHDAQDEQHPVVRPAIDRLAHL